MKQQPAYDKQKMRRSVKMWNEKCDDMRKIAVGMNTEKDRKGQKWDRKAPKSTEKHVITYYLPKRRENVAEGGENTGQQTGNWAVGWKGNLCGVIAGFSTTSVVFSLFSLFSVGLARQVYRLTDWRTAREITLLVSPELIRLRCNKKLVSVPYLEFKNLAFGKPNVDEKVNR